MKVTLRNINKEAKRYNIELVKGSGYFYWYGLDDKSYQQVDSSGISSVMTYRLTNLTWNQWMMELADIIKGAKLKKMNESAMYDRDEMPQIKSKNLNKAIRVLRARHVNVKEHSMIVDDLKPSQKDIDTDRVLKIKSEFNGEQDTLDSIKPLIISSDNHIVDGHHRWLAVRSAFPGASIPVIQIFLPRHQAISIYNKVSELI